MSENLLEQNDKPQKPDNVPDKFWNAEEGSMRMDALLKSYLALEQKQSQKAVPVLPESAEAYDIKLSNAMLQSDPEINARLYAKGFTNEQVQEVYDLAAEKLVPMIMDVMQDAQADREIDRLVEHFGGAEAWARVSRQLLAFGQKNLPAAMLQSLASSYEGVLTLHKMMNEKSGTARLEKDGTKRDMRPDEKELAKMMRDPRYWRDRDPKYIAKVTEGFQELYN